jgi:hypothetical protein
MIPINYLPMNKIITCITILVLSAGQSYSQQLISTAGQQQNNVSWSIGEMITDGGSVSGKKIYQGFNSPDIIAYTGLADVSMSSIVAYPNPVIDKLFLKKTESGSFSFTLTDLVGRVLLTKTVDTDQEIDLSHFDAGQYILKVYTNQFSKSTILIKK